MRPEPPGTAGSIPPGAGGAPPAPAAHRPAPVPAQPAAAAVIDTNIWLDLYVFADAGAQALAAALAAGTLAAVRSAPTDAELRLVLGRPAFAARCRALGAAPLAGWETLARQVVPYRAAPWLCRDPDDQKFLDLAHSAGASWLFTKDRALLSLARRARRDGLHILEPRHYPNGR